MWNMPDEDLIEQGKRELAIARAGAIPATSKPASSCGCRRRIRSTTQHYKANVDTHRDWLEDYAPNVHPVGRNGMHRYNNQDHSMFTAMLTVENIARHPHDVWAVNVEEEYHEEKVDTGREGAPSGTGRAAPVVG